MPKPLKKPDCPWCKKPMKLGDHGEFVCTNVNCTDKYVCIPKSIFGVS